MQSSLMALPLLKKRLRRITSIGFENLTIKDCHFLVYFTLHRYKSISNNSSHLQPFYTSESIENERNPEWSSLEFPIHSQNLQDFQIVLWLKTLNSCRIFLQYGVHLDDSLVPDVQKSQIEFDWNRLWIEMFGFRFTDSKEKIISSFMNGERILPSVKSYDRSSLLRMMSTVQAIRMEKQFSEKCLQQINKNLKIQKTYLENLKDRESRIYRIESLQRFLISRRVTYQQQLKTHQENEKRLEIRKRQYSENLSRFLIEQQKRHYLVARLTELKSNLNQLKMSLLFREKLLLRDVFQNIYPIDCDEHGQYSIVGIRLPMANEKIYDTLSSRDKEIIAAIEFCAHFLLIISRLILYPLRYPIDLHRGSPIRIYDQTIDNKEFLLDPSHDLNGFRYGFYLLNRNISQLMFHFHINKRRLDHRKTLENLKTLIEHFLYFQTPCLSKNA